MRNAFLVILSLTIVAFLSGLSNALVWDDVLLIAQNQTLQHPIDWGSIFLQHLWAGTPNFDATQGGYYRPLVIASFAIDRTLFGESFFFYHLHSLGWHLINLLLLHLWLRLKLQNPFAHALALGLFAFHPLQIESIAFLSARNDIMACTGMLGMLLCFEKTDTRSHLFGGLFLLFGLLSKESVLLSPLLLIGYLYLEKQSLPQKYHWWSIGSAFAIYAAMRWFAGVSFPPSETSLWSVFLPSVLIYASRLVVSTQLLPGTHVLWLSWHEWIYGFIGILLVLLMSIREKRTSATALLIFFLGLFPALSAISSTGLSADRYLYLPLVGIALLLGKTLDGIQRVFLVRSVSAFFIGLWLVQTIQTLPAWKSDLSLFATSLQARENPYRAGAYAKILEQAGKLDTAAFWYERATQPPLPYRHSCYNVTQIHLLREDPTSAIRVGEAALEAGCEPSAELLSPLALAHASQGNWKRAEDLVRNQTRDPRGHIKLLRLVFQARKRNWNTLQETFQRLSVKERDMLIRNIDWLLQRGGDLDSQQWLYSKLSVSD
ncbi:MAG: hypothetical protein VX278_07510 [Myxococcota bacterium]|nr:hypothetical protein [Myxococcota bacterium]